MAIPQIQTTGQVQNPYVKVLVYGQSNAGKTTLCSTAPSPLILSVEGGLLSIRSRNTPYMDVTDYAQLVEIHRWLMSSHEPRAWFQTICIDSLSEVMEKVLLHEKGLVSDKRQAYGALIESGLALVRMFRNLPYHICMTAQMESVKDEVQGGVKMGPSVPGSKLGPKLPYHFDEVFKADIGVDKANQRFHYLMTQGDLQSTAKDRSGMLAPVEHPDLSYIFNKIMGQAPLQQ